MTATRPPDDDLDLDALDAVRIRLDDTIREQKRAGYGGPRRRPWLRGAFSALAAGANAPDTFGFCGAALLSLGIGLVYLPAGITVFGLILFVMGILLGRAEPPEPKR